MGRTGRGLPSLAPRPQCGYGTRWLSAALRGMTPARLESAYTGLPYRGFESLSLRQHVRIAPAELRGGGPFETN